MYFYDLFQFFTSLYIICRIVVYNQFGKKLKIGLLFFIVVFCFVSFSCVQKDDGKKVPESFPDGESQKFESYVFELERFHKAQTRDLLRVVEKELTEGKVKACYMWYIFPQIHGLGQSEKTKDYSIKSLKEAKSYLDYKVLRERLVHHTKLVLNHRKYKTIW
jgi:hypothetical protein